jgi:acyl dehydratase
MNNLQTGYEFPPIEYSIDREIVKKYEDAVETESHSVNYIPPLAIAAYAMKAMTESSDFPPGVVHISQDFQFLKPVEIGGKLYARAKVVQKIPRSSMTVLTIEINTYDQDDRLVIAGKATAFVPNQG